MSGDAKSGDAESMILELNDKFYEALVNNDIGLMESVWLRDEKAKCVHPGWPMLYGWEAIKESWESLFESDTSAEISLSDIDISIAGNVAWVICIEKVSHRVGDEIQAGYAQSTNLYERSGGSWRMVLHHASPVPVPRGGAETSHRLQ